MSAAERLDFFKERLSDNAFAVIAHDYCGHIGHVRFERAQKAARDCGVEPVASFAINPDDLLFVGNDSRFDAGWAGLAGQQIFATDVLLDEEPLELLGGNVLTDNSE